MFSTHPEKEFVFELDLYSRQQNLMLSMWTRSFGYKHGYKLHECFVKRDLMNGQKESTNVSQHRNFRQTLLKIFAYGKFSANSKSILLKGSVRQNVFYDYLLSIMHHGECIIENAS